MEKVNHFIEVTERKLKEDFVDEIVAVVVGYNGVMLADIECLNSKKFLIAEICSDLQSLKPAPEVSCLPDSITCFWTLPLPLKLSDLGKNAYEFVQGHVHGFLASLDRFTFEVVSVFITDSPDEEKVEEYERLCQIEQFNKMMGVEHQWSLKEF